MVASAIPIKTPEGQAELSRRSRRVSQRHRTALFLIDGKRSTDDLRSLGLKAGVPESCFDELLEMGLISVPAPRYPEFIDDGVEPGVAHIDLPLPGPTDGPPADAPAAVAPFAPYSASAPLDSLLPASRTLSPESVSADSALGELPPADSWSASDLNAPRSTDAAFMEARAILVRAVRAEAPLSGSLTLLRLRRARNRVDLTLLLGEVETRISKPTRSLAAAQTMLRVRQLLDGRIDSALASS